MRMSRYWKGWEYHITGTTMTGKRFKIVTPSIVHAMGINVYRGTVWSVDKETGKRKVLRRVWN